MKKVAVIGHLDWTENHMIGAVVKARNILAQLEKQFGSNQVGNVDIYMWRNRKKTVLRCIFYTFAHYRNIVLVCSDTSVALMTMFKMLKMMFHNKILYCVVGGNMADLLENNPKQIGTLSSIDCFFVETQDCVEEMKKIGIDNVQLCRNFKSITPVSANDLKLEATAPIRFCTFSRVVAEKGITDAINAITEINIDAGDMKCTLDIYGSVEPEYKTEFEERLKDNPYVTYKGVIDSEKSVHILKDYYCLLFPTKFQTEGIPGTIIDVYAAGIPVICSNWIRCSQIVTDGVNGIVYLFDDYNALVKAIKDSMNNPGMVLKLKHGCLESFELYRAEKAIEPLVDSLI